MSGETEGYALLTTVDSVFFSLVHLKLLHGPRPTYFAKNVIKNKSVGNADTSDIEATEVISECLPETPVSTTVQDAKTLLPSLSKADPLESSAEVTSESEAYGVLPDLTNVTPSSNTTAVTETSTSVPSFEYTAETPSEMSTVAAVGSDQKGLKKVLSIL